mgnify:CR=1 FL=1
MKTLPLNIQNLLNKQGLSIDSLPGFEDTQKAYEQFEEIFLRSMLKDIRSQGEDPLFGSDATDTYTEMYDAEISKEMSKAGGIGLSNILLEQWVRSKIGQ